MKASSVAFASLAAHILAAAGSTFTVQVGADGQHAYDPEFITINSGDTINFVFDSGNFTLTQSSFNAPCVALSDGITSGFLPVPPGSGFTPEFSQTFDDTTAQYFFCEQVGLCGQGMVFAINPSTDPNDPGSFDAFKALAMAQNGAGSASSPPSTRKSPTSSASTLPSTQKPSASSTASSSSSVVSPPQGSMSTTASSASTDPSLADPSSSSNPNSPSTSQPKSSSSGPPSAEQTIPQGVPGASASGLSKAKSNHLGLAIGITLGLMSILLAILSIILVRRRRRKRLSTPNDDFGRVEQPFIIPRILRIEPAKRRSREALESATGRHKDSQRPQGVIPRTRPAPRVIVHIDSEEPSSELDEPREVVELPPAYRSVVRLQTSTTTPLASRDVPDVGEKSSV